jgi:NADH dehydrogenase [ubiquinone] 1 alpha subcomplex assembly factor 7
MFGELLGLCLAQAWLDQGAPGAFALAELGPGRGTLMADICAPGAACRASWPPPGCIWSRPRRRLRAVQAGRWPAMRPSTWHDARRRLPEAPLFLIANEFFDALPVRQFLRAARAGASGWWGWRATAAAGLRPGPAAPLAALAHRLADTREGDWSSLPRAAPIMAEVAGRIARQGGAALIVDYGGWRSRGDTLQALRGHARPTRCRTRAGRPDRACRFRAAGRGRACRRRRGRLTGPQGVLLEAAGHRDARAERLARGLDRRGAGSASRRHRRLTHRAEMGTLFKALAIHAPGTPPPQAGPV